MNVQASDLIAAARAMTNTPFHHQGRAPGVGLDCIGLVVEAMRACGMSPPDRYGYGRSPTGELQPALQAYCGVPVSAPAIGDVALFRVIDDPQHVALITDRGIIHAYGPIGRVAEHQLDAKWRRRLVAYYRLPGVISG